MTTFTGTSGDNYMAGITLVDNPLSAGSILTQNQGIMSPSGNTLLVLQHDGNAVIYQGSSMAAYPVFSTYYSNINHIAFQTDGNIVAYDAAGNVVDHTGTSSANPMYFQVQDDGNTVFYNTDSTSSWNSATYTNPPPSGSTMPWVQAGAGDSDAYYAGAGDDTIDAGAGDDSAWAGDGHDVVYGDTGADTLYGQNGHDSLYGGAGKDGLHGGRGDDILFGGAGNDSTLMGNSGDDLIYGGTGDDTLWGGFGNDTLDGGAGNDVMDLSGLTSGGQPVNASDIVHTGEGAGYVDTDTGRVTFSNITHVSYDGSTVELLCFCRGTLIETAQGPVAVENLTPGMLVRTRDNGLQPIIWTGHKPTVSRPVRIRAGTLGNTRDLRVSPRHRMVLSGWPLKSLFDHPQILIAAVDLVNDDSITQDPMGPVDYYHVMFDAHEIIYAEGIETESFHPDQPSMGAMDAAARAEIFALFPELEQGANRAEAAPSLGAHEAAYIAQNLDMLIN